MAGEAQGGIIQAAMELIKEKERQGDKAMDRLHDGFKTQMQLTANQGSWTGDSKPAQVIKEKETVKEKVKEPEEKTDTTPSSTSTPTPSPSEDKKEDNNIADMGIFDLAKVASK
ncbi:MAG: hypothetical protein K2N13_01080 [Paraprevotella sp.]|nr:hypothetical protein [Paraprevotella sp.]